jgi:hypothetical protein
MDAESKALEIANQIMDGGAYHEDDVQLVCGELIEVSARSVDIEGHWPQDLKPAKIEVESTKGTVVFKDKDGGTIGYGELFVGRDSR